MLEVQIRLDDAFGNNPKITGHLKDKDKIKILQPEKISQKKK